MKATTDTRTFTAEEQADLRKRCRQIMEVEGKTQKALATESGVKYGTFTGWLADTYQGNNDWVAGDVAIWLESREANKRARMQVPTAPAYVETKSAETFVGLLRYAQVMPDIAVIAGGAGIGKTTVAQHYRETNPNVVMVSIDPSTRSNYTMLGELIEEMGLPEKVQTKYFRAIGRKLQGAQALIIVDEAQHLDVAALEQLRAFHDKFGIGVALVGNESVYSRIEGGKRSAQFAQLFSRIGFRVTQAQPAGPDICALLAAWGVTDREELHFCKAIASKPGALRVMTKTLQVASLQAAGAEEERGIKHIKAAYTQLTQSGGA